jgi:hypothetical protein
VHAVAHLPDVLLEFGPLHEIWEFGFERLLGFLKHAGAKQRAAVGAAIANRQRLHARIQTLSALVAAGQPGAEPGPPPPVQVRGQLLSTRAPNTEDLRLLQRWAEGAMPEGFEQLRGLHAAAAAISDSQSGVWEWLDDLLGVPDPADLEGLSRDAQLIAGGFGARLETFALVEVRTGRAGRGLLAYVALPRSCCGRARAVWPQRPR